MNMLMKHAHEIMAIDKPTLTIFLLFCGIACWIIRDFLANPAMIIVILPFLILVSMLAYYVFLKSELVVTTNAQSWLTWAITAATIGLSLGLGCVAGLMKLLDRDDPRHNVGN